MAKARTSKASGKAVKSKGSNKENVVAVEPVVPVVPRRNYRRNTNATQVATPEKPQSSTFYAEGVDIMQYSQYPTPNGKHHPSVLLLDYSIVYIKCLTTVCFLQALLVSSLARCQFWTNLQKYK